MHTSTRLGLGIVLVGALSFVPQAASSAQLNDKELEAIALGAMTPLPPALRAQGDVTTSVTTKTDLDRGLDMCENADGAGLYSLPPDAAINSTSDTRGANGDDSQASPLTEVTVDISKYSSTKRAKKIWRDTVRGLKSACDGAIVVPSTRRTLDDGANVVWTSVEFNDVTIGSTSGGPVGLFTTFVNHQFRADDPTNVTSSWMVQQYSSWRLAGNTIVRSEVARLWAPVTSGPGIDPSSPAVTEKMKTAVDRMTRTVATAIERD